MCAERNAIANMITNGENGICRLIAVDRNGKAIPPCGRLPGIYGTVNAGPLSLYSDHDGL